MDEADPIWGETAYIIAGEFDGWTVTNPRVDGSYKIARSVIEEVRSLPPTDKARMTTWIVDQHLLGESMPMINSSANGAERGHLAIVRKYPLRAIKVFKRAHNAQFDRVGHIGR